MKIKYIEIDGFIFELKISNGISSFFARKKGRLTNFLSENELKEVKIITEDISNKKYDELIFGDKK